MLEGAKSEARRDGQEVVEAFKVSRTIGGWAAAQGPDMVISDFLMSPINGTLLLRWLREAPRSPHRFVLFVML